MTGNIPLKDGLKDEDSAVRNRWARFLVLPGPKG